MKYKINEVTKMTGITSHTIRYYEKEGIIPPIERNNSGVRLFSKENIFWLELVSCMKKTKMPVSDIKSIVELSQVGDSTIPERKEILIRHRENIDREIEELQNSRKKLQQKIAYYEGTGDCF